MAIGAINLLLEMASGPVSSGGDCGMCSSDLALLVGYKLVTKGRETGDFWLPTPKGARLVAAILLVANEAQYLDDA